MQFALLKSKAADGDSFVVVGRCADEIFNGICDVASIFITASDEDKIKEITEQFNVSESEAKKKMVGVTHEGKKYTYDAKKIEAKFSNNNTKKENEYDNPDNNP